MSKIIFFLVRKLNVTIVLTNILFVLTLYFGSSWEAEADGLDRVGFPFTFYQYNGGKCHNCAYLDWFKLHYLILDLVCLYLFSILLTEVYFKFYAKRKIHKNES